jgi:hypothetical protein
MMELWMNSAWNIGWIYEYVLQKNSLIMAP